ncbi:uncharacterized protein LOC110462159 [Mizuhopecten yessoensis]|uniref:E3 ubiquitin-protein ligase HERC2 n=1 Tax=Mizuhopecten yessoensis TaxID=6573 RepID=A0A210PYR6_MIZYE|nr:uncharacterized protein LOC110462159 [Mizuhopecten yessoensis]OWF41625.1 E3 ubiquitin-protein ligase HERC2 [Mizuhopecten yessoensis]
METDEKENPLHSEQGSKHLAEMKESISEIERTNNFILKRLDQQHDKMDGENLHIVKLTEALMQRLQDVERRECEQDEEMQQLVRTVAELGDTVSSMCTGIDNLKFTLTKEASGKDRHRRHRGRHDTPSHHQETVKESPELDTVGQPKEDSSESGQASGTKLDEAMGGTDQVLANERSQPSETTEEGTEQLSVIGQGHNKNGSDESQKSDMTVTETIGEKNTNPSSENADEDRTVDPTNALNSNDEQINAKETGNTEQHYPNGSAVSAPNTGADQQVDESEERQIVNGVISDEMWNSVVKAEANKAKDISLPYGDGIDTVFVVDISDSMKENGLQQAKDAILEIIDWIEMVAKEEKVEENVGVVTFGHITQCRHYLTKDYNSVRQCIAGLQAAGSSPLYGGLDMALALFKHEGDATTLVCNHKISPRIVLLSDGQATDHHLLGGQDDQESPVTPQVRDAVLTFTQGLAERRVPVYCVPIGDDTDQSLLIDIAKTTSGQVVSLDEVYRIGRHCSNLACVLRVRKILPHEGLDATALKTVVKMTEKNFSEDDLEDMMAILDNPVFQQTVDKGFNFDELTESDSQMPPIGSRVRKGPEWKWKNQDLDGVGTVIGHGKNGWIKVEWDCSNKGEYRYGNNQAFDVVFVEEPRLLKTDETIATGCVVCRGIDWEYEDQDGGFGKIGTVYHTEPDGQVWVRWPNGHRGRYHYTRNGKQELVVCDPFEVHQIRAEQRASVEAEEGAAGGINLRSRSSSISESSSIPDLPCDDDLAFMSIYDMVPASRSLQLDDEEDEEEDEDVGRVDELSLVEAMNKRNESAQSLPPRKIHESELSDQSHMDIVSVEDSPVLPVVQKDLPSNGIFQVDLPKDVGHSSVGNDKNISATSLSHHQDHKSDTSGSLTGDSVTLCEGDEATNGNGLCDQNTSLSVTLEASVKFNESVSIGTPLSHSTPSGLKSSGSLSTPDPAASGSIGTPVTGKQGGSESVSSDSLNITKSKFSLTEQQKTISHPTEDSETAKVKTTYSPPSPVSGQSPTGSPGSSFRALSHPAGSFSISSHSSSTSNVVSATQSQISTNSDFLSDTFSDTASLTSASTFTMTDVVWQWEDKKKAWHSFSPEQNRKIEKTRKRSPRGTVVLSINGEDFRVVMYKSIQIHTVNRSTNNIRCIDSDVANLGDVET